MDMIEVAKNFDLTKITFGDIKKVVGYLEKYGYLKDEYTVKDLVGGVKRLHSFFDLDSDTITDQTLKIVQTSRCGCPDNLTTEELSDNNKWAFSHLKYYFDAFVPNLTKDEQREYAKRSYDSISAVCGLTFEEVSNANQANIIITTGRDNGLGTQNEVLAYAFLPSSQNHQSQLQLVFDQVEFWITDKSPSQRGIYYQNVHCHESLHNLGLAHSQVSSALMAPFYSPKLAVPQQNDDIARLVRRYGPRKVNPVPPPVVPVTPTVPTIGEINIKIIGDQIIIPGYRIQKLT